MSVRALDGYTVNLAKNMKPGDADMALRRGDAIKLNAIGVGNHVYLTVTTVGRTEIVRYDHVHDWDATDPSIVMLPVQRDVAGIGPRGFPYGACVKAEVNSFYVRDLVEEMNTIGCANTDQPDSSEASALPTTMFGGRDALLGEPDGFVEVCGERLVPYYNRGG